MSSKKRPFDWPGLLGSGSSSKRPKSPAPQAASSNTWNPNPFNASQSTNPPTTSFSTNVPRPGAPVGGHLNSTGHAMLSTLRGSMKLLRKSCRDFPRAFSQTVPPLQETVEALFKVFEGIETTKQGSEELRETVSDLAQWAAVLSDYLSDSSAQPEQILDFVKKLEEDLAEQAKYIEAQQCNGKLRRLLESGQEIEDLERCYRRIETSFRQLQTDAALRTWKITDDHLKESRLNVLNTSHHALYNSSFSDKVERRGCLENTRGSVLNGIRGWIFDPSGAKIYWTNGMAGTGKTTIAYSVCTELERDGRLGASFFCSRASSECSDVSRILPTIAYQLAQQFYPFRSSLCRILGQKPSIGHCNISDQFEYLIKTPLIEAGDMLPNGHVIVIDALDECSDPRTVEIMLDALFSHAANLPIRFFLTSRPEPAIANTFISRDNHSHSILHLHNVEEQLVKADIETYLTTKLAKLSLKPDQIEQLAEQAGVLFIYAATLARYVLGTKRGANASARLITALTGSKNRKNKKDREIDLLYKAILDGVLGEEELEEDEVELIKHVIWAVVCAREPVTIGTLAALLKVDSKQVSAALEPLRSVLNIFENSEVVSTLHASFPEFMLSSERSGASLYCNETTYNEYLARRCFELMTEQLKFNICSLETSYRFDKDVPDLEARVYASISSGLFYACRYWADHLSQLSTCDKFVTYLNMFLDEQLLFWMEVLNLKGRMGSGARILVKAQRWLTEMSRGSETSNLVRAAYDFVSAFANNPSNVRKSYWGRTRGLLWVDETQMSQLDPSKDHDGKVGSVAFLLDGTHVITGSWDYTLRLRNIHNDTSLGKPFKGHTDVVSSVAFSSDGAHIVSGSWDCTVRVWDLHSGIPLGSPFEGHTDWVSSVAFSPDNTLIASGSGDHTIRVWNVQSGTVLGSPFKGHTHWVRSVAFSPDGTRIVSGSYDCTIRVWDMHSGATLGGPFKGHTEGITSVAFSPIGTHIASGSCDRTIRVWDVHNGIPLGTPFKGHTDMITSVAFSPDGTRIVSGSGDLTIRVWDVHSSTPLGNPLKGHTAAVTSVSISLDGAHIVSGSWDHTIRLWEVHTGAIMPLLDSPPKSHTSGTPIMSSLGDSRIRVWQGLPVSHPQATPFGVLELDDSGWLVDSASQTPILWLPKELHDTFPRLPNTITVSPLGLIEPNWTNLLLGASWAQCYKPFNGTSKSLCTARRIR